MRLRLPVSSSVKLVFVSHQAVYTNLCKLFKKTGYADSLSLYREKMVEADAAFKKVTGMTPAQYCAASDDSVPKEVEP